MGGFLIQATISTSTSVCPSIYPSVSWCVQKLAPFFAVVLQNVTDKSCLVCVKSEKQAFKVTLRVLGSMRGGKAKLCTLQYQARQNQPIYIKTYFSVSLHFQCQSQAVLYVSTPRMYPQSGHILVSLNFRYTQCMYFSLWFT